MAVTEVDIRKQVRRLRDVYSSSKSEDQLVNAFNFVFRGEPIDNPDLMAAVTSIAKEGGRFMPNPGVVLQRAKQIRGEERGFASTAVSWDGVSPCPTCGAKLQDLEPHEQVRFGFNEEGEWINLAPRTHRTRIGHLHDYRAHARARCFRFCAGYWR